MFNLITIGDALIDTHVFIDNATLECDINQKNCQLCLNYAAKIPITHSFQTLGGNAANVAAGASKLGLHTSIFSSLGNDANGDMVKENLEKQGINTDLLSIGSYVPTRYSVVLNFKQERTILSYHQKRDYLLPEDLPAADWMYYSSLSEGYETFQENLITYLQNHETVRVAYNPGSIQLKNIRLIKDFLAHTEMLIVNLEEAEIILGATLTEAKSVGALIHGLLLLGPKEVAITDSTKGAWAGDKEKIWHCDSFPVEVRSKTGAGDAFSAAYLAARFYKESIDTALLWGIANSCHIIAADGPEKTHLNKKEMGGAISKFASIKPTIAS